MTQEDLKKQIENMEENTSLKQLQEYVNKMIEVRGFEKETPQDIMLLLTEEMGELAKEIRKTTNIKIDIAKKKQLDVEGEIADVFLYLLSMCRVMNIDLLEATKKKEELNCKRTWK